MILLEVRTGSCEPEEAPILAVHYPTRTLLAIMLEKAAELQQPHYVELGIREVRLGPIGLPCIDSEGGSLLATTELVIEADQVWWTGYEVHAYERRDRWETVPVRLQDLEYAVRVQGNTVPSLLPQLVAQPLEDPAAEEARWRVLEGVCALPDPGGEPLDLTKLWAGLTSSDVLALLQHSDSAVRERAITSLADCRRTNAAQSRVDVGPTGAARCLEYMASAQIYR